ncbi:oligosaccharide flippase family protein [Sneathiella limimaris]|uniref:oligosaccharide flippase family protein n=1 Tax=Sneathiella limimaris TaxID=1964213 RepID=UPI00146DA804|nr:oligosaccharide flippase family protein [Sneathiella limimaris]
MESRKFIKSGLILSAGSLIGACSAFGRNVLIARYLSVENYGIATTFAIVMTLVEATSNIAIDRFIVQSKYGNNLETQKVCHFIEFIRGLLGAVFLFLSSGWIAALFNLQDLVWAYQMISVVPFIRGLLHLDVIRFQREQNFVPTVFLENLPQVISLVAVPVFALFLDDYMLMIGVILSQVFSTVIISHLFAMRNYRLGWGYTDFRAAMRFGWPLILNGMLLFGVLQADRTIVGSFYSIEELGWFGAAFALSLFPASILSRVAQTFLLPKLAAVQENDGSFSFLSEVCISACILLGSSLSMGLIVGGGAVLTLFYGPEYALANQVIAWLALMQGIRVAKAGTVIVAIGKGKTKIPMYGNMLRILMIPFGVYFAWVGADIVDVVLCGVLGEYLAFAGMLILMRRHTPSFGKLFFRFNFVFGANLALTFMGLNGFFPGAELQQIIWAFLVTFAVNLIFLLCMPDFFRWLKESLKT